MSPPAPADPTPPEMSTFPPDTPPPLVIINLPPTDPNDADVDIPAPIETSAPIKSPLVPALNNTSPAEPNKLSPLLSDKEPVDTLDDPLVIETDPVDAALFLASLDPNEAPDIPNTLTLPSTSSPAPETNEIDPPIAPDPAFNTTDPAIDPFIEPVEEPACNSTDPDIAPDPASIDIEPARSNDAPLSPTNIAILPDEPSSAAPV